MKIGNRSISYWMDVSMNTNELINVFFHSLLYTIERYVSDNSVGSLFPLSTSRKKQIIKTFVNFSVTPCSIFGYRI